MKAFAIVLSIALAIGAGQALAAQTAHLKTITASAGPVTLGDLLDVTGEAAKVSLGAQVRAGGSVAVPAAEVQRLAQQNGYAWANEGGLRYVIVYSTLAAPAATATPASTTRPSAAPADARSVEVLTWSHSLETGDIVRADDLTWSTVPRAPDGAAEDADDLIGKAAKRPLRSGSVASRRDVSLPQVIKKDDLVYVTYSAGGVTLEMKGKAKGPAAVGDNVDVVNTVSGKVIQAIASGPGRALVGPEGQALRATALTDPSRLASR